MTYNPNIPQPTDIIAQSQPQILTNFTQLNAQFAIDHVAYTVGGATAGHHQAVHVLNQALDPTTGGTEGAVYAKVQGGNSEAFYRYQSSGPIQQVTNRSSIFGAFFAGVRVSGTFGGTAVITGTPINVASIMTVGGATSATLTVNFTNNAPSLDYFVFYSIIGNFNGTPVGCSAITRNLNSFVLTFTTNLGIGGPEVQIGVFLGLG